MDSAPVLSPRKRRSILAAAARVFAQDGYEGASMARIALDAAVSKGTLYNHFNSKAALFAAFVEDMCAAQVDVLFDEAVLTDEPARALREMALRMMRLLLSPIGLTVHRVVTSEAAQFPELARRFYEAGPAQGTARLSHWLAAETRAGRLAVPDPAFAAEQFFALTQTKLVMRRRLLLIDEPSESELAQVADHSVALFLRAYGTSSMTSGTWSEGEGRPRSSRSG